MHASHLQFCLFSDGICSSIWTSRKLTHCYKGQPYCLRPKVHLTILEVNLFTTEPNRRHKAFCKDRKFEFMKPWPQLVTISANSVLWCRPWKWCSRAALVNSTPVWKRIQTLRPWVRLSLPVYSLPKTHPLSFPSTQKEGPMSMGFSKACEKSKDTLLGICCFV